MSFSSTSPFPDLPEEQPRRSRGRILAVAVLAVALLAGGAYALAGGGTKTKIVYVTSTGAPSKPAAKGDKEVDAMAPLPDARPKLVQPTAGEIGDESAAVADLPTAPADTGKDPKITGPASASTRADVANPGVSNLQPDKATALPNGVALPPLDAPEQVLDVIRAGNIIARSPYKWGGGHGRFQDNGYDCSGSVSYALYYAGLIDGPHVSGELMAYGKPGPGKWITIYASPTHVYMEVAGIRFDTSGQTATGSRWQNQLRNNAGMEARHPEGL